MPDLPPNLWIMEEAAEAAAGIDLASKRNRALELVNSSAGAIDLATDQARLTVALDLANSPNATIAAAAASYLAHRRHSAARTTPAAARPAARRTCGVADDLGHCIERYHDHGCAAVVRTAAEEYHEAIGTPGESAAWDKARAEREHMRELTGRQAVDADGRTWFDQHAEPMTLAALLEEGSGMRLTRDSAFETGSGNRELRRPVRRMMLHNQLNSPGHPGTELYPEGTAALDAYRNQVAPHRETPSEIADRRAASMHRQPQQAVWWGDAR